MAEILATSSVLIAVIFLLRKLTVGKISMRVRYALWLLAALRLLIPVSVGTSPLSVMNLMPETFGESGENTEKSTDEFQGMSKEKEAGFSLGQEDGEGQAVLAEEDDRPKKTQIVTTMAYASKEEDSALSQQEEEGRIQGVGKALGLVWFLGFLTVGGCMLLMRIRFVSWLYGRREILSGEMLRGAFSERLARRRMRVYRVGKLPSQIGRASCRERV